MQFVTILRSLTRSVGRTALVAVVATALVLSVAAIAGAAIGGETTPRRYTGCLKSTGALVQFKAGDSPTAACPTGTTQITLGNGDVTGVKPGTGLTGGGVEGTVTVGLAATHALPQGCATGAVPKRSATGWYCGTDIGALTRSVGGLTATHDRPSKNGNCVGDYSFSFLDYTPPTAAVNQTSPSFTLPTGTYQISTANAQGWSVQRTLDHYDGEQFSRGFVRLRLVRTRSGSAATVATWTRVTSDNSDFRGMPSIQDPGVLTALATDTFVIVADAGADYCTKATVTGAGFDFTRIG